MNSKPPDAVVEWWIRHPSLATLVAAASTVSLGVVVLWWHVATVPDSPNSPHVVAGDFVLFGMIAALVVVVASFVISRQRRG